MAIVVTQLGSGNFLLTIDETNVGPTTEVSMYALFYDLPTVFRIYVQDCQILSGTATTVDPILLQEPGADITVTVGGVPQFDSTKVIIENLVPGPGPSNLALPAICRRRNGDFIYHRARPNTGTDNTIRTVYSIRRGWEG